MTRDLLDRHRSLRILIGLLIVAISFYVIGTVWSVLVVFGGVVLLFLLAWIVAFILEPVSVFLQRRGLHKLVAVSLIYFALLVVVSGGIVLAVPAVEGQINYLASQLTTLLSPTNLPALSKAGVSFLRHFGFKPSDAQRIINQASQQLPQRAQDFANAAVASATNLVASILTIIFDASLVVILSFYIMLDGGRLCEALVRRLPTKWIPDVRLFQRNVQDIFAGYFRAQLIVAGIYAALTWLILLFLGQPNGILAAVLSGILMLLPFIGVFLAILPPALLIVLSSPADGLLIKLLILVILLGAAQHLVLNLLAPRIFGQHMGVPTLVLFAALLLGAQQGGVWGAFFAAPVIGVGWAMFEVFYERFQSNSDLFQDPDACAIEEPPRPFVTAKRSTENTGPDQGGDGTVEGGRNGREPRLPSTDERTLPREPVSPGSSRPD
ncbi:MAG: AI-2E family transporter [Ktedonobacterales bacterium]